MSKKRAQITLYLILGIVLLLSIGLLFYIGGSQRRIGPIAREQVSLQQDAVAVKAFVNSCLKEGIDEGIDYFGVEDYKKNLIDNHVSDKLKACAASYKNRPKDFEISFEEPTVSSEISESALYTEARFPIRISKEDDSISFEQFTNSRQLLEKKTVQVTADCLAKESVSLNLPNDASLYVPENTKIDGCDPDVGYVAISMTRIDNNFNGLPNQDLLGTYVYSLEPSGVKFSNPVELSLPIAKISGVDKSGVKVAIFDENTKIWQPVATRIDETRGLIIGELPHFTKISLQANCNKGDSIITTDYLYKKPDSEPEKACGIKAQPGEKICGTAKFSFTVKPSACVSEQEISRALTNFEFDLTPGDSIKAIRFNGQDASLDGKKLYPGKVVAGKNTLEFELENNGDACCAMKAKFAVSGLADDLITDYDYSAYNEYKSEKVVEAPKESETKKEAKAKGTNCTIQERINFLMCPNYPSTDNCKTFSQFSLENPDAVEEVLWLIEKRGGNLGDPNYAGDRVLIDNIEGYKEVKKATSKPEGCVKSASPFTPSPPSAPAEQACSSDANIGGCKSEGRLCSWCAKKGSAFQWVKTTDCAQQYGGDDNAQCNCENDRQVCKKSSEADKPIKYSECKNTEPGKTVCSTYWQNYIIKCLDKNEGYGKVIEVCEGGCKAGKCVEQGCSGNADVGTCKSEGRFCSWCAKEGDAFKWVKSTDCAQQYGGDVNAQCKCENDRQVCRKSGDADKSINYPECRSIDPGKTTCSDYWTNYVIKCTEKTVGYGKIIEICPSTCYRKSGSCSAPKNEIAWTISGPEIIKENEAIEYRISASEPVEQSKVKVDWELYDQERYYSEISRLPLKTGSGLTFGDMHTASPKIYYLNARISYKEDIVIATKKIEVVRPELCVEPYIGMRIEQDTKFCKGEYYLPTKGDAIEITKGGIALDCNGAKIYGREQEIPESEERLYEGTGVLLKDIEAVTIKNCDISRYRYAIKIGGGGKHTINGNTLSKNYDDTCIGQPVVITDKGAFGCGKSPPPGAKVKETAYATKKIYSNNGFIGTIRDDRLKNQLGGGIEIKSSNGNKISNNKINYNSFGISLFSSNGNTLENNNMDFNTAVGVYMQHSSNNVINKNSANYIYRHADPWIVGLAGADAEGILMEDGSDYNKILYNDLNYDAGGLFIRNWCRADSSDYNLIEGNTIIDPETNGLEAGFSSYNQFKNNKLEGGVYGFWVGFETNDVIEGNRIKRPVRYGDVTSTFRGDAISGEFINGMGCGVMNNQCSPTPEKFIIRNNVIESSGTDGISVGFYRDDSDFNEKSNHYNERGDYKPDFKDSNGWKCTSARFNEKQKEEYVKRGSNGKLSFGEEDAKSAPPATTNLLIENNIIVGSARYGIRVSKVMNSQILNNEISNSQTADLIVKSRSVNNVIENNKFCTKGSCTTAYYIENKQPDDIAVVASTFPESKDVAYNTKVYDKSKDPSLGTVSIV